jgi:formate dehydrogenase iron-sulfur subunit
VTTSITLELGKTPLSWPHSYDGEQQPRMGFFTDTSVCIGCKACEVACKEWNEVPEDGLRFSGESFDNTGALSANSWRHVAFIEQPTRIDGLQPADSDFRWLMSSDVCKHCTHAACLDVCPTGALFRTEFGTVVVQQDVCNGCGYCVPACPFGVIGRRETDDLSQAAQEDMLGLGTTHKCTLCYDRLKDGMEPACAQACPTESIQFGTLEELRERAQQRVERLHEQGVAEAELYGESPDDGVGGFGAFFLLLDKPEVYGLPPDPIVATRRLPEIWGAAFLAGAALAGSVLAAVAGGTR